MSADLVDLLGAMADYFKARDEYNAAVEEANAAGAYSFDWYGRSYIEALEQSYERVVTEWEKVFASV